MLGFLVASLVVTWIVRSYALADYNKLVKPALIAPITALRTWAFTFSFLSIGLTTRLKEFAAAGARPALAFLRRSGGECDFGLSVLSVLVFGKYWAAVATH